MEAITPILIDAALKSLAILLSATIITLAMRKSSAAARHLVWSGAIVAVLVMPMLSHLLPGVPGLAVLPVSGARDTAANGTSALAHAGGALGSNAQEDAGHVQHDAWSGLDGEGGPLEGAAPAVESAAPAAMTDAAPPAHGQATVERGSVQPWWQAAFVWLSWVWLGGAVFALIPLALGWLSLWHLKRTTQPITGGSWQVLLSQLKAHLGLHRPVTLLRSPCRTMPMTWGGLPGRWGKAAVLIPEDAYDWSPERRRAVLLHELAHVKRYDCLTQLLTQVACALYWFNPLMWYAAHRTLIERERACDDLVLTHETKASDYAQHLLDIATGPQASFFAAHAGIAMARRSKLDGRVVAILDQQRNRCSMTRLGTALTLTLIGALALPVACVQVAEPQSAAGDGLQNREPSEPSQVAAVDTTPSTHAQADTTADEAEEPDEADDTDSDSQPKYTSRYLDYSLRDEPQRIPPRTLDPARPTVNPHPGDAIVLGWPIRWWSSHWAGSSNTAVAALTTEQGHPRLRVFEPGRTKVWVKYLDMPIDAERYPILVFTYRARHVDETGRYVLYLDDGSGPDYGGLKPVRQSDLVDDGQVQTVTADLRELEPIGKLIGMAIGLQSPPDGEQPAELEVLDIRFESVDRQVLSQNARSYRVAVRDQAGAPVAGASVISHAERRNWARSALTGANGEVTVLASPSDGGPDMLRVEAEGHLPVELRELPTESQSIAITMPAAAPYAGVVVDEAGDPVAGAVVRLRAQPSEAVLGGLWTRRDAEAVTDERGRWTSAPLAASPTGVQVELAHPEYSSGPEPGAQHTVTAEQLMAGDAELSIGTKEVELTLNVRDEAGDRLDVPVIVHADQRWRSAQNGEPVQIAVAPTQDLLVRAPGYVPQRLVNLQSLRDAPTSNQLEHRVRLARGDEAVLRFVDKAGEPLTDAVVGIYVWAGMRVRGWNERTDAEGKVQLRVSEPVGLAIGVRKNDYVQRASFQLQLLAGELTVVVPRDVPDEAELEDGRRPGYDPQRIFRRISDALESSERANVRAARLRGGVRGLVNSVAGTAMAPVA